MFSPLSRHFYSIAAIIFVAITGMYLSSQANLEFLKIFAVITVIIAPAVVTIQGYLLARKYGKGKLAMFILYLTAGIFLWFLGELTWGIYELILSIEVPYPSIADIFYLLGYLPLIAGVMLFINLFYPALSRKMRLLTAILSLLVTLVLVAVLYQPLLNQGFGTKSYGLIQSIKVG